MKTYLPKESELQPKWWIFDAKGQILGRFASEIAHVLRGKHKPYFTPFMNCGDFVIVLNAGSIGVTGNKEEDKIYYKHTGRKGNMKKYPLSFMRQTRPERIIELAVKRMLPDTRLASKLMKKLKVYNTAEHPHAAQMPEVYTIKAKRR